jgi:hypothetical protein
MIEKEINETYSFNPDDFNEKGRRESDGLSFRDLVKDFEYDFHRRHSTEYALNFAIQGLWAYWSVHVIRRLS